MLAFDHPINLDVEDSLESILARLTDRDFNDAVIDGFDFPSAADLTCDGSAQEELHDRAARTAREWFGARVFVRAVVELSNICRESCAYCGMRRQNLSLHRVRARVEELEELILNHRPACVTDINLQAGEDPVAVRTIAIPLIKTIRRSTNLGISVCLGTLDSGLYRELQDAGATIYIMKFECGNEGEYDRFHAPGTLSERLAHVQELARSGWAVSSGYIAGLPGQTVDHLRENLRLASSLPLRGCSVSPFIPGEATPLVSEAASDVNWSLNCIATMRLMRPDWVIPAVSALNMASKDGYRRALRAGANLVTINMTPQAVRKDYLIYRRDRLIMTEERILTAIAAEGLSPCPQGLADYYANTPASQPAVAATQVAG